MNRKILKKSYSLRCASYILTDVLAGKRAGTAFSSDEHGITHLGLSPEESIGYVENVFNDYKRYSGIERFHGRIAEVGPGDNCGVALLCLADGVNSVDLADRFHSRRDPRAQAAIYSGLAARHAGLGRILAKADLADEGSFPGLRYFTGEEAAAERFFGVPESYDFILSRAVFEHLYDPVIALTRMAAALKSGGRMLHKVDFRNHGLFAGDFHELKFLEVPERLYRMMNRHSARPNRVLVDSYKQCLDRLGLDYRILVTQLAGHGAVEPNVEYRDVGPEIRQQSLQFVRTVRGGLAGPFRRMSEEDLSVSGIFIIASRPSVASPAR